MHIRRTARLRLPFCVWKLGMAMESQSSSRRKRRKQRIGNASIFTCFARCWGNDNRNDATATPANNDDGKNTISQVTSRWKWRNKALTVCSSQFATDAKSLKCSPQCNYSGMRLRDQHSQAQTCSSSQFIDLKLRIGLSNFIRFTN